MGFGSLNVTQDAHCDEEILQARGVIVFSGWLAMHNKVHRWDRWLCARYLGFPCFFFFCFALPTGCGNFLR